MLWGRALLGLDLSQSQCRVGWSLRILRTPLGFELSGSVRIFGHDELEFMEGTGHLHGDDPSAQDDCRASSPWPSRKHRHQAVDLSAISKGLSFGTGRRAESPIVAASGCPSTSFSPAPSAAVSRFRASKILRLGLMYRKVLASSHQHLMAEAPLKPGGVGKVLYTTPTEYM